MIGVIDIGTNTCNAVLAHKPEKNGKVLFLKEQVLEVGLLYKITALGIIHAERLDILAKCIISQYQFLISHGASDIFMVATSAIRQSPNGTAFLNNFALKHNISCEIIDGKKEASFIWQGIAASLPDDDIYLALDIGGGSCEWMIGSKQCLHWSCSIEMGMARIMERFGPIDLPSASYLDALSIYYEQLLKPVIEAIKQFKPKNWVGAAGTFETICTLLNFRLDYQNPYQVILNNKWYLLYNELMKTTLQSRLKIIEAPKIRASMIIPAFQLINWVQHKLETSHFGCSAYALREGYALQFFN